MRSDGERRVSLPAQSRNRYTRQEGRSCVASQQPKAVPAAWPSPALRGPAFRRSPLRGRGTFDAFAGRGCCPRGSVAAAVVGGNHDQGLRPGRSQPSGAAPDVHALSLAARCRIRIPDRRGRRGTTSPRGRCGASRPADSPGGAIATSVARPPAPLHECSPREYSLVPLRPEDRPPAPFVAPAGLVAGSQRGPAPARSPLRAPLASPR